MIYQEEVTEGEIKKTLEKSISEIDYESSRLDFNYTQYYREEMGSPLKRKFYSFKRLYSPEKLYKIKIQTNRLERKFVSGGKRKVNLDPGYLTLSKLILFSTKNFSHRIYIGKSIYAEVTLRFEKGKFTTLPWTFPDYTGKEYRQILQDIRKIYKQDLRKNGN